MNKQKCRLDFTRPFTKTGVQIMFAKFFKRTYIIHQRGEFSINTKKDREQNIC